MPDPDPTSREPTGADPARRRFFRDFAGEVVNAAATVVGAATVLQKSSAEAAHAILHPDEEADRPEPAPRPRATPAGPPPPDPLHTGVTPSGFRTAFRMEDDRLILVDQRRLPGELVEHECRHAHEVAFAIREMIVRGAPAIGQAAALGLALSAARAKLLPAFARQSTLQGAANALRNARPTAINLRWAVDRIMARYEAVGEMSEDGDAVAAALRDEADSIVYEATDDHGRLAEIGLGELPAYEGRPLGVLTHCNTGPLACGQFGTALGVIQVAHHEGREVRVFVDETRPHLQGARLTAWELAQAGVDHTLIADVAAGSLIAAGEIDAILVGADRIAANGDTANKVGTYTLAVLAAHHGVPFLVCAPTSTVDLATPAGSHIPIEERPADEVLLVQGVSIAPPDTEVRNPAFDITPAELITAIVTEEGALRAPYEPALRAAVASRTARRAAARSLAAAPIAPAGVPQSAAG